MATDAAAVQAENARLKKELAEAQQKHGQEIQQLEMKVEKERSVGKAYGEQIEQKTAELSSMRNKMVKLTRQLDEEVTRRDVAQSEAVTLQCKVQDISDGTPMPPPSATSSRKPGVAFERGAKDEEQGKLGAQGSTKIMRVIDHWMTHRDLQQALLRNAGINDMSFATLTQVLSECPSLQSLDLSDNQITMDSCSEICSLITTAPNLSFVSLANNQLSLRSLGYFMTAIMERQNSKKLAPLDILDLHGNEGIVHAANATPPENLVRQIVAALGPTKLPPRCPELVAQVQRSLWRFLHETGHPQVRHLSSDDVSFQSMDKSTVRKMEAALMRMLLCAVDEDEAQSGLRSVTAELIFVTLVEVPDDNLQTAVEKDLGVHASPAAQTQSQSFHGDRMRSVAPADKQQQLARSELRDPFEDLKAAFEAPKEKLKTFNLKQIVTRNGTVLMNMLERLLDTTEIDAHDVETEQTLLEFACQTGNVGLAKLCYRRGANLSARTKKGDTAFNIVTRNRRYDMMEFLHKYGVKVNSSDADGQTALHIASASNDMDGVCRLLEWGADVNIRDNKKRTPLHTSAGGGHKEVTMLLLEVGAELNAKDSKEYTPVARAEANDHFTLMDRLKLLGGQGHGLSQEKGATVTFSKTAKGLGELTISPQMLKSSSLGRLGKVKVHGLPDPLRATLTK